MERVTLDIDALDRWIATMRAELPPVLDMRTMSKLCGISRVTAWRLENAGKFPPRMTLATTRAGYVRDELLDWLRARRIEAQERVEARNAARAAAGLPPMGSTKVEQQASA